MADTILEPATETTLEPERREQGDVRTEEMLVNMGPQHPSTHGVLRVVLRTDGEMVLDAIPHVGYLHRCAEKIGEALPPYQYIPYTDRMDYLAGMNNNQAFAIAVERLCGLEVPPRAQAIRVIFSEFNRIASHLVALGTYGLDMGAFTPFLYAFREREMILDLFEAACGARLTYSYPTVGGVRSDGARGLLWLRRWWDFLLLSERLRRRRRRGTATSEPHSQDEGAEESLHDPATVTSLTARKLPLAGSSRRLRRFRSRRWGQPRLALTRPAAVAPLRASEPTSSAPPGRRRVLRPRTSAGRAQRLS